MILVPGHHSAYSSNCQLCADHKFFSEALNNYSCWGWSYVKLLPFHIFFASIFKAHVKVQYIQRQHYFFILPRAIDKLCYFILNLPCSFNDTVAVYDIMNVSSVLRDWEGTKQMCRLQWDTLKTRNHQSTRKRGIKKHDLSLSTKQDDSQTARWKKIPEC